MDLPNLRSQGFSPKCSYKHLLVYVLHLGLWSSLVNFYVWSDVWIKVYFKNVIQFFHLLKRLSFSTELSCTVAENLLFLYVWVYFCILYSILLFIYLYIYNCILKYILSSRTFSLPILFFKVVMFILGPLHFYMNFRINCLFLEKRLLGFSLRLCCIYR